jgi:glucose/arabinose dehydrogenase
MTYHEAKTMNQYREIPAMYIQCFVLASHRYKTGLATRFLSASVLGGHAHATSVEPQVVAQGLENPWAVAFIDHGHIS